ncbi:MAG TPA: acyl-ACP--UDP-N-acetylglucosamine O-acyltransferase [Gemmatimonadales bacterium]|jgi:UDP-N-acetylglucosamine acyltransferase
MEIHKTAIVSPQAELGDGVSVGPYAIIGPNAILGAGCAIASHAVLEGNVRLGERVKVGVGSVLGGDPQDLKYKGEETWAEIGDDSVIREFVTVNRGTTASFRTTVGKGCLLMSYVHVGHDCHLSDGVIVSSTSGLAGHVEIGARAIVNGMVGIQQFVRIGTFAYVGGHAGVRKDVPPYCRTDGERVLGLNKIGLERSGFSAESIEILQQAYRYFFRSSLNVSQALERVRIEITSCAELEELVRFIESSERGVMV